MKWITSDQHFNHSNIIEYCNRPFDSTFDMDTYMISQWNKVVKPNDTVLHLGDFALGMDKEGVTKLLSQLNGRITLVRGNHDRFGKQKSIDCGFENVLDKYVIDNFVFTHRPLPADSLLGIINTNIHGHIHNYDRGLPSDKYFNVSADVHDYTPISFKKIKGMFQ